MIFDGEGLEDTDGRPYRVMPLGFDMRSFASVGYVDEAIRTAIKDVDPFEDLTNINGRVKI